MPLHILLLAYSVNALLQNTLNADSYRTILTAFTEQLVQFLLFSAVVSDVINVFLLLSVVFIYLKPNSITLASSELAPNMFGASSELASVMEFGFYFTC